MDVRMDYKESWAQKNFCFWTVVLEKTLESPLDCKEIKPINPGLIFRESVLNIHWKDWYWSWSSNTLVTCCKELTHLKGPWCWERLQEEKGMTDDEMVGWHHRLDGHEFEQPPGVGDGAGVLQSMGSHRVIHDWATELNSEVIFIISLTLLLYLH